MLSKYTLIFGLFILLFLEDAACFNSNQLCKKDCADKKNCTKTICPKPFGYKCSSTHCSTSSRSCSDYLVNKSVGNTFWMRVKAPIESCSKMSKTWSTSHVCRNPEKCLYKPTIWVLSDVKRIWIDCPCRNKYKFKCGKSHCTKDKETCDGFNSKKQFIKKKLTECDI